MSASKGRTLSPAQLHALSFFATRGEWGRLMRVLESAAEKVGLELQLPRVPMSFNEPSTTKQEGGHTATVSRSSTRLFALVYSIAAIYELLLGLLRRKKLSTLLRSLGSISALRLASAVSLYSTIYRLLLPRLSALLPSLSPSRVTTKRAVSLSGAQRKFFESPALPPFLAAVAASPAMLLEGRGQRRVTIALYALTRALHGMLGVAGSKGLLTRGMKEGRWWWGGHIVFAAANSILLHAFVYNPSTFPAAYSNFILKYSGAYLPEAPTRSLAANWPTRREIVDAVATATQLRYPAFVSPLLIPSSPKGFSLPAHVGEGARASLEKIAPILAMSAHPGHSRLTCAVLHPEEQSCWDVFSGFVRGEFLGASKFFGALAVLGTLTRWKKFLNAPEDGIYRALVSTVASSAFLSLSLGTAWSTICFFQHYLPKGFLPTKRWYLQGFLAGLWVRLVGAQRSADLGMYSARMAIQTAWDVLVERGRVRNLRNGDVLFFAASMGVLLAIHETNPATIQSKLVRSALRRVGGPPTVEAVEEQREDA